VKRRNTSPTNLKAIAGDADNVAGNLLSYIHDFSSNFADIFDRFEMPAQASRGVKRFEMHCRIFEFSAAEQTGADGLKIRLRDICPLHGCGVKISHAN
jgi:hypothetical protein